MSASDLISHALKAIKSNAPEILTALGISGVATTSYLVAKASFEAARKIEEAEENKNHGFADLRDPKQRLKERTKLVWKMYIPAGLSGFATVACIVGSSRAGSRRTSAAIAAYSFTEKAFSEYKDKAKEALGAGKEQRLRDDLAQEQVRQNPPSKEITIIGDGEVLCCELRTNRYFLSNHEALQRAVNEINFMITHDNYVSLSEFYILIGLPITEESVHNGWTFEKLMELEFSTALTDENKPCLTFRYNYVKPLHE